MIKTTYSTEWEHIIIDAWFKKYPDDIVSFAEELAIKSGLHIVRRSIHYFEPQGETILYTLSESHLAIHTYPEHKFMSIDVYTCGEEGTPMNVVEELKNKKILDSMKVKKIVRWKK